MNAQLSNHPLNRAAEVQLRRVGTSSKQIGTGTLEVMPLLLLPMCLLDEMDLRLAVVSDYARSEKIQALALKRLEPYLDPDDLMIGMPEQAAEEVANELQPELGELQV